MEQRKKWKNIAIGLFVLAVVIVIASRFIPKPAEELESVVEQYLLGRTLVMVVAAVSAFGGLAIIVKKLCCPHCGGFGLNNITVCGNCGKDLDAPVEEVAEETAETAEPVAVEAAPAELAESTEPVTEEKE